MFRLQLSVQLVFTLQSIKSRIETKRNSYRRNRWCWVFTLQSIKSRIETSDGTPKQKSLIRFLLYSPLNQGLKPEISQSMRSSGSVFTLQSIKSRIETIDKFSPDIGINHVFTLQSIKSRIETGI